MSSNDKVKSIHFVIVASLSCGYIPKCVQ